MLNNEKGFSLLEGLLIASAVLLISFAGYYVWSKHNNTVTNNSSYSAYSGTQLKLKLFGPGSTSSLVSLKVPDGWVADKSTEDSADFFADQINYQAGKKFTYSKVVNNRDIERFMLSLTSADDVPKEYASYDQSYYGLVNGYKTTLYHHQFSKGEHIGNVQMQGGEKEYMYFMTKSKDAISVQYYILANDKDQKKLIEQVINTVRF